jgi:hypothetical protein
MKKMKNKVIFLLAVAIWLTSCEESKKQPPSSAISLGNAAIPLSAQKQPKTTKQECSAGEELIYDNNNFSTYTEDKIRGKGVVSFQLDVNDRLNIYNEDDSDFGYIVLNENLIFFTLQMPKKLVARKVIPEFDFAAFDFDAEEEHTNKEYLFIYANGGKKKVKKAEIKYSYKGWNEYIKDQTITPKPCNKLENAPEGGQQLIFTVTTIDGDRIHIKSSPDCAGEDTAFQRAEGWIKWRKNDLLLVDLRNCN